MNDYISVDNLAHEIRHIYSMDSRQAEERIATYLQAQLGSLSATEKIGILDRLTAQFDASVPGSTDRAYPNDEVLARLFSLVLGDKVTRADLSSGDLLQRLAESLNTIFDALNKLVAVIDSTLRENGDFV